MAPRNLHVAVFALPLLLMACPDETRPGGLLPDGAITDMGTPEVSDDTGTSPMADTGTPITEDTGGSLDADVPVDTTTPDGFLVDVPPMMPPDNGPDVPRTPFCNFEPGALTTLALRASGCLGLPAQQLLTEFYRLEYWEAAGPFSLRPCDALRCAATARTCTELRSDCLKFFSTPTDGGVCSEPPSCARTVASRCEGGRVLRDDCGARGQRCIATGTEAACVPETTPSCATGSPPRCNGDTLERCVAGVYAPAARCAFTLSRCDVTADACVGTGDACTATACEGTFLRACRGGRAQRLDCGQLIQGGVCQTSGESAFCGLGTDCNPVTAATATPGGRCEGSTLVVCGGGRTVRFDCTAEGFRGCGTTGCVE